MGHRAKPSRWRRSHSFIHLTNIYLTPPVCQAPCRRWEPVVNQPRSQTQSKVGRVGTSGHGSGHGSTQCQPTLPGGDADPHLTDLIFQERPKTQLSLSNEFFSYFQMLATNFKFLNHCRPNATYLRAKSSPFATSGQVGDVLGHPEPFLKLEFLLGPVSSALELGPGLRPRPRARGGAGWVQMRWAARGFSVQPASPPTPSPDSPPT